MDRIQITAKFQIEPEHLDEFKQLAASCIKIVKHKDKGTLQYDWFFNEGQTECAVRETYLNSNALLEHIEHVGELLERLFEISVFTAEIYGNPSIELRDKIQGEGVVFYKRFTAS